MEIFGMSPFQFIILLVGITLVYKGLFGKRLFPFFKLKKKEKIFLEEDEDLIKEYDQRIESKYGTIEKEEKPKNIKKVNYLKDLDKKSEFDI